MAAQFACTKQLFRGVYWFDPGKGVRELSSWEPDVVRAWGIFLHGNEGKVADW
jgi:hypothetical protein